MNIILGKPKSGKDEYILKKITEDIKKKEEVIYIVPEQFSYTYEKEIIKIFESIFTLDILSFTRLQDRILQDSKYMKKTFLNEISRSILLKKILNKLEPKILRDNDKNIETISNQIEEFKRYETKIEDLKKYLQDLEKDENQSMIKLLKLKEMIDIYEEYDKEIDEKFLDSADKNKYVIQEIEEKGFFKGKKIYINSFDKFTESELKIIKKIMEQAKELTIAITADSSKLVSEYETFSVTKKTISRLKEMAKELDIDVTEELMEKGKNDDKKVSINLTVYKNIEDELSDVARKIRKEVFENKKEFSSIAVISNSIDENEKTIRNIFTTYNLPIHIDTTKKIEQNNIAKYILGLLEILTFGYDREKLIAFLKLGYFEKELEELATSSTFDYYKSVSLLEKYLKVQNIQTYNWKNEWKNYENIEEDDFNNILKLKQAIIDYTENLKQIFNKEKTGYGISKNIYLAIMEEKVFNFDIDKIDELNETKERKIELKKEYITVVNKIKEILDDIVLVSKEEEISYKEYYENLKMCFSKEEIKNIPPVTNTISFVSQDRANIKDVDIVYITSLIDGQYPKVSTYQSVVTDEEKEELKKYGIKLSDSDIEKLEQQQFLMYKTLMLANEKVELSYYISDMEDNSKMPSLYIIPLKKKFNKLEEIIKIKGLYDEDILNYSKQAIFSKAIEKYLEKIEGKNIEQDWLYVIKILKETNKEFRKIENAIHDKNKIPNLNKEILEEIYTNGFKTSVSKLEEYAKCPFAYYIKYTLEVMEERKYEINNMSTGTLLHDVLEQITNMVKNQDKKLPDIYKIPYLEKQELVQTNNEMRQVIGEIIEKTLAQDKYKMLNSSEKFKVLTKKFESEIVEAVMHNIYFLAMSRFKVYGNEINIEKMYEKDLKIEGKVDRADIFNDGNDTYLRVIDYKSSYRTLDEPLIKGGLQLQLLTYLDVLTKNNNFLPAGSLYFSLNKNIKNIEKRQNQEQIDIENQNKYRMSGILLDDIKILNAMDIELDSGVSSKIIPVKIKKDGEIAKTSKNNLKNKDEINELLENVEENIKGLSFKIKSGDISIKPYKYQKQTGCDYCPYKNICKFDIKKNHYRKIKNKE